MKENVRQTLDLHRPKGAKTAANKIKKDRLQGESRQIPSHHVDEPTDAVGGRYGEGEETEKQTKNSVPPLVYATASGNHHGLMLPSAEMATAKRSGTHHVLSGEGFLFGSLGGGCFHTRTNSRNVSTSPYPLSILVRAKC